MNQQEAPKTRWKGVKEPQMARRGNYALPTGFTFDAVLVNAIFSYNLLTPAVAVLEEDIAYLGEVVLPKDTRFIGTVQAVHSLDRVNIDFTTCVFPDGQEVHVQGMALSPDGSAGVVGKRETHKDVLAAKTAMKTIFAGASVAASAASVASGGGPTIGNSVAANLSQEAANSIDTSSVKDLDSIAVEGKAAVKIFLHVRTEF